MVKSNQIKRGYYTSKKWVKNNDALILLIIGLASGATATYMGIKAAPKAKMILDDVKRDNHKHERTKAQSLIEEAKAVAPLYVAPVLLGMLSIGSLIGSYHANTKKTATFAGLYAASDKALKDYQAKVIETVGETKEQAVRDAIKADEVRKNPPKDDDLNIPEAQILCYDSYTGRYFNSTVDEIRNVEAVLNKRLVNEMYISLNDFYYEIGLAQVPIGDDIGWNIGEDTIDITFSSTLTESNKPVLVIDYSCGPRFDFRRLH